MEIKLGKWEKGDMRRIYFNALALGNSKVYAYANKNGLFAIGQQTNNVPGQDKQIDDAINAGVAEIEKLIGKPISYDTKFDDVWAAIK